MGCVLKQEIYTKHVWCTNWEMHSVNIWVVSQTGPFLLYFSHTNKKIIVGQIPVFDSSVSMEWNKSITQGKHLMIFPANNKIKRAK